MAVRSTLRIAAVVSTSLALAAAAAQGRPEVDSAEVCAAGACDGHEQSPVALMQMHSQVQKHTKHQPGSLVTRINNEASAEKRAALLKPVAWMHPMKCGSSFFNVLVGLESLWTECPARFLLDPASEKLETKGTLSATLAMCPGVFGTIPSNCNDAQCWWGGHMSIGTIYEANKGHFTAILRQPEQMLLSGYNELHAWMDMENPPKDALEYVEVMQGCQVKMLARDALLSPCRSDYPWAPTAAEVALALERLSEGFAWVGITDDWDLSICTFHAKFGGACLPSDFADVNPGVNKTVSKYDTSVLGGWTDEADGQVFAMVQKMAAEDQARYGVSAASCATWCW